MTNGMRVQRKYHCSMEVLAAEYCIQELVEISGENLSLLGNVVLWKLLAMLPRMGCLN